MTGALPARKTTSTGQHLKVPGGPTGSSSTRHEPQSTNQAKKSTAPDAGHSKSSPSSPAPHKSEDDPNEPPQRITSLRPDISPAEPTISASEADDLCSTICARIWNTNLGHMFDKVVAADRRGQVDDKLYSQLLDFFYCFVPMVVVAPRSDPVIVKAGDLRTHRKIMK